MLFLDMRFAEVRELMALFRRMHGRLSNLTRAAHCRTAAISMYGLEEQAGRHALRVHHREQLVELHIRFSEHPVVLREANAQLLVLKWYGSGFMEIFNGPVAHVRSKSIDGTISMDQLRGIEAPPEQRLFTHGPDMPRLDARDDGEEGHGDDDGDGGDGDDGDNGGDGDDGGDAPGDGEGNGGGGLREVVSHPVLFSADPNAFRRLLEDY